MGREAERQGLPRRYFPVLPLQGGSQLQFLSRGSRQVCRTEASPCSSSFSAGPSPAGSRGCSVPQLLGTLPSQHFAGCRLPPPRSFAPLLFPFFFFFPQAPGLSPLSPARQRCSLLSPGPSRYSAAPRDPSQGFSCLPKSWQLPGRRRGVGARPTAAAVPPAPAVVSAPSCEPGAPGRGRRGCSAPRRGVDGR